MGEAKLASRLSALSMGVAAVLWIQAASAADEMPSATFQTITVTANQSSRQRVQHDDVTLATDIPAQQANHLSDVLESVPGVSVGGTSSVNQRIQIRGLDDTDLKVTIDGARQEGYLFHHMGDVLLDPDLLKAAEVAVGNNSVTLGNNALGGGVAFTTVDANDLLPVGQHIGARLRTAYASNNDELLTSAAVYAMPNDDIDMLAYYGKRTANAGTDGEGRKIQTNDSDAESILVKLGAYVTPTQRISGSFQRTENSGNYPIRPDFPLTEEGGWNPAIPQEMNRDSYTLGYHYQPNTPYIDLEVTGYHNETEIVRSNGAFNAVSTTKGGKVENTSRITTASSEHKLIGGVEHYTKESSFRGSDRGTGDKVSGTDHAKNTSVYLEDQWRTGKLTLTPGVRYDHYTAPEDVAGGEIYDHVVGALAASYQVVPSTNVFASYTQLFNGPDLNEIIRNRGGDNIYLTPDLEPETGDNSEIGFASTFTGVTVADDRLNVSGKYFVTRLDDVIESVSGLDCATGVAVAGGKCSSSVNKDERFDIKGFELAADYALSDYTLGISYARARSEGDKTGDSLYRDTGDRYSVDIGYQANDALKFGWRSQYVTELTSKSGDSTSVKPRYDVHDLYASYEPSAIKGLTANVGVYNLFDETYADHASRVVTTTKGRTDYEAGRNVKVSLSYQF